MILTTKKLKKFGACQRVCDCLKRNFGGRAEITQKSCRQWIELNGETDGLEDLQHLVVVYMCGVPTMNHSFNPKNPLAVALCKYLHVEEDDPSEAEDALVANIGAGSVSRLIECVLQCAAFVDARGRRR